MLSCCQVYKITKQLDCLDFDTYFKYRISVTRSHDGTLVIPSSRINAFRYSFFVNVPFYGILYLPRLLTVPLIVVLSLTVHH